MTTWSTPPTFTAQPPPSADLQKFSDDLTWIRGDTTWTAPTLASSWSNLGAPYLNIGYRLVGDTVHLRGVMTGGTFSTLTAVFTLPTGYRPSGILQRPVVSGTGTGYLQIDSTGKVFAASGTNTLFSLDGVIFSVL